MKVLKILVFLPIVVALLILGAVVTTYQKPLKDFFTAEPKHPTWRLFDNKLNQNLDDKTEHYRANDSSVPKQEVKFNASLEEQFQFPPLDVPRALYEVTKLLEDYIHQIKIAKTISLSNMTWVDYTSTNITIDAFKKDYFTKLNLLSSVRTVLAENTLDNLIHALPKSFFHYASSDCESVEKVSVYGQDMAQSWFNDTCHDDVQALVRPMPLNENYMRLGLPDSYKPLGAVLTFMHVISNALVLPEGDAIVDDVKIMIQRCSAHHKPKLNSINRYPLYREVLSIAQYYGDGFFHGVIENMIRIAPYLPLLRENSDIMVHVNTKVKFMVDLLKRLGIQENRLVTGAARCTVLYLPAGTPCGRPTFLNTNLLSLELQAQLKSAVSSVQVPNIQRNLNSPVRHLQERETRSQPLSSTKDRLLQSNGGQETDIIRKLPQNSRNNVVLIQRSGSRSFIHHNAIWNMTYDLARQQGLRARIFSDRPLPGLEETADMFGKAVIVIAPHGAGLSNLVFSKPGTIIIEALCYDRMARTNLCYRNLAKVLGHRYYGLLLRKDCEELEAEDIRPALEYFTHNCHLDDL